SGVAIPASVVKSTAPAPADEEFTLICSPVTVALNAPPTLIEPDTPVAATAVQRRVSVPVVGASEATLIEPPVIARPKPVTPTARLRLSSVKTTRVTGSDAAPPAVKFTLDFVIEKPAEPLTTPAMSTLVRLPLTSVVPSGVVIPATVVNSPA